jgi:hypothetical protein
MRALGVVLLIAGGLFSFGESVAGVPSPVTSIVPRCVLACPQGDIADTVIQKDIAGNPQQRGDVVMDFSQCTGFSLCSAQLPPPYMILSPTQIHLFTDSEGRAIFNLQVSGTCTGGVKIYADYVLLTDGVNHAVPSLVNVDQNGDGVVTSADQTILAARSSTDPLGDLNCDGVHDGVDMTLFAAHLGHQCPSFAVPARGATWGLLKIHYR